MHHIYVQVYNVYQEIHWSSWRDGCLAQWLLGMPMYRVSESRGSSVDSTPVNRSLPPCVLGAVGDGSVRSLSPNPAGDLDGVPCSQPLPTIGKLISRSEISLSLSLLFKTNKQKLWHMRIINFHIYLKGTESDQERDTQKSSTQLFTPQKITTARSGSGQSQEPNLHPGLSHGGPSSEPPSAPFPGASAGTGSQRSSWAANQHSDMGCQQHNSSLTY